MRKIFNWLKKLFSRKSKIKNRIIATHTTYTDKNGKLVSETIPPEGWDETLLKILDKYPINLEGEIDECCGGNCKCSKKH